MSDFMELGDSGLVPQEGGWFLDKTTGNRVAPDGRVYNKEGELIWDPSIEDDYEEEYDR